jgi:hypothetical protein
MSDVLKKLLGGKSKETKPDPPPRPELWKGKEWSVVKDLLKGILKPPDVKK